ncbi:MAG: H-NS histone family protein [Rhodocyclaceae bacterium]|nr:H-NS histone family protein [Rhodocyclaceae bacterium]
MSDLSGLSYQALKRLGEALAHELASRQLRDRLAQAMHALARSEGLSLEEVLAAAEPGMLTRRGRRSPAGPSRPRQPARIRYVHPSNRALRWSGRGRTPAWIHAWLSTGGSMTALENAAEKLAAAGPIR